MKILITGGGGFIGQYLVKRLIEDGDHITVIDNHSRVDSASDTIKNIGKIEFLQADLRNKEIYYNLQKDYEIIYHLAAIVGVQNVNDQPYSVLEDNLLMLSNVIAFAKENAKLKKIVYFSTSEVYAGTLKYHELIIPTPESSPITLSDINQPRSTYMLSKIYGEAMINHCGLPYIILRPHNIYGPNMGESHVIPQLIRKSLLTDFNEKVQVDSVEHTRAFCYIDDAINQIYKITKNNLVVNSIFNIGNMMEEISIGELAALILHETNRHQKIKPTIVDNNSPQRRCPDVRAIEEYIGQLKYTTLLDGVKKCIHWYSGQLNKEAG